MLYASESELCLTRFGSRSTSGISVETKIGNIIGQKEDGYYSFYGVPYAKVDLENPFGAKQVYPNFKEPFYANDSTIMCPQVFGSNAGTLQCLTLNIYVPEKVVANKLRPILVWFFGGGFARGSANEYGGQHLVKHDIIVVTVNYRLGPYGFLCLDIPEVTGNQGLKDQIAALRWLRKNIISFGGNASKITIAGESYGGGAVDLHLYSNYKRLFDKAIIQSGSIFAEGFYMKPDYQMAVKFAKILGYKVANTTKALELLAKKNPSDVMNAAKSLGAKLSVCKEKRFGVQTFVTESPFHLKEKLYTNVTVMIGYNSKEDFGSYVNRPEEYYKSLGDVFYNKLKDNFVLKNHTLIPLKTIVKKFYLGGKDVAPESMLELSDFTSDFRLNSAAERSVDKLKRQGVKLYKYLFSYIGGSPYKNLTGVGAIHTEELSYLFEYNGVDKVETDEQKMMRDRMTELWANFVKFGNPTPEATEAVPIWPDVVFSRPYMNIDVDMSVHEYAYHDRIAFWDLLWAEYWQRSVIYDRR